MSIKRLRHTNSRWRPKAGDCIINWGATRLPAHLFDAEIINHPDAVASVVDKRDFFLRCDGTQPFNVPEYWTSKEEARHWLWEGEGTRTLVARTILRGHEGTGIVLLDNPLDMVNAPLYTAYVKKRAEYRVHVVNGEAIDVVQKKKKAGHNGGDNRIRNTNNGYVFCRNNITVPQTVIDNAINAVKFYGLDFGAADVIYNEHHSKAYVLEINTAPGIEGTTVQKYKEAFEQWLL
jgi:glutathione synthase/RimK-type ligase-like ATP-grasp enzyme